MDSIRKQLETMLADIALMADELDSASSTVTLDQTRVGRLSRMDALQSQELAKDTQRRREQSRRDVLAAIRRLECGEYGECVTCLEPIAELRLAYNPAVSLCIACANAAEQSDH